MFLFGCGLKSIHICQYRTGHARNSTERGQHRYVTTRAHTFLHKSLEICLCRRVSACVGTCRSVLVPVGASP